MPPSRTAYFRRLSTVAAAAVLVASTLALSPPAAAQTQPFTDTSSDSYYSDAVAALADNGIFDGTECAEGMLCPEASIDRKTMAVWTVRALDGQDPTQTSGDRFTDVDANSFHAPFIERMDELGVTSGCGDGTAFCPHDTVNRAQMAVFLTRAFNLDPGPDPGFTDVAADAWYYNQTAALAASGITAGCGDGTTFCPNQPTNRAQMATFLARALGLVDKPTPAATAYKAVTTSSRGPTGCVLDIDGKITCWLDSYQGGPGYYGSPSPFKLSQMEPIDAPHGSYKYLSPLAPWGDNVCAIGTDHTITCWRFEGQENEFYSISEWPYTPSGTYDTVATNSSTACAIRTDGTVTCWGSNSLGTADNSWGMADAPQGTYKTIAAGAGHFCAIGTDHTITCWGLNDDGQADAPQGTYKTIAAGFYHSCAIRTDGTITCWGGNSYGQADAPQGTYNAITAGIERTCAIGSGDTVACWGTPWSTPWSDPSDLQNQIHPPEGAYIAVSPGELGCAISTSGTITCWAGPVYFCCGGASPRGW